jgi:hypothetical protein
MYSYVSGSRNVIANVAERNTQKIVLVSKWASDESRSSVESTVMAICSERWQRLIFNGKEIVHWQNAPSIFLKLLTHKTAVYEKDG